MVDPFALGLIGWRVQLTTCWRSARRVREEAVSAGAGNQYGSMQRTEKSIPPSSRYATEDSTTTASRHPIPPTPTHPSKPELQDMSGAVRVRAGGLSAKQPGVLCSQAIALTSLRPASSTYVARHALLSGPCVELGRLAHPVPLFHTQTTGCTGLSVPTAVVFRAGDRGLKPSRGQGMLGVRSDGQGSIDKILVIGRTPPDADQWYPR